MKTELEWFKPKDKLPEIDRLVIVEFFAKNAVVNCDGSPLDFKELRLGKRKSNNWYFMNDNGDSFNGEYVVRWAYVNLPEDEEVKCKKCGNKNVTHKLTLEGIELPLCQKCWEEPFNRNVKFSAEGIKDVEEEIDRDHCCKCKIKVNLGSGIIKNFFSHVQGILCKSCYLEEKKKTYIHECLFCSRCDKLKHPTEIKNTDVCAECKAKVKIICHICLWSNINLVNDAQEEGKVICFPCSYKREKDINEMGNQEEKNVKRMTGEERNKLLSEQRKYVQMMRDKIVEDEWIWPLKQLPEEGRQVEVKVLGIDESIKCYLDQSEFYKDSSTIVPNVIAWRPLRDGAHNAACGSCKKHPCGCSKKEDRKPEQPPKGYMFGNDSGYLVIDTSNHKKYVGDENGKFVETEYKPDFNKLRKGDLVVLYFNGGEFSGYIINIDDEILTVSPIKNSNILSNQYTYHIDGIKKIIRINIDKPSFIRDGGKCGYYQFEEV